jgi:hypothetical protein
VARRSDTDGPACTVLSVTMYEEGNVMTPSERARLLQMILDEHDQAIFELRDSSNAFDAAISSMRQTLGGIQDANHARGRATIAL